MKLKQTILGSMAFAPTARSRAYIAAGLVLTLGGLAACKDNSLLQVTDPDVLPLAAYNTPAGADPLRIGVIGDFTTAFDGSSDGYTVQVGNMSDELITSDTFNDRLEINARQSIEVNSTLETVYTNIQRARANADAAIKILVTTQPTPTFNRGELFMLRGYSELFLGEAFCSGVAFSSEDGTTRTYGPPQTTNQIMVRAAASFDSALALADTSKRVLYGAAVGKARALLNQGNFAAAGAAAASVPQSFQLLTYHDATAGGNGMWSAVDNGATRYEVTTSEGINGLPFLANHSDPRTSWTASTRNGFNSSFVNLPTENKYGRYANGVVDDGIDAKLMVIEANLNAGAGSQASFDAEYAALNALRASGPPTGTPALTTGSPTTMTAAVTLLYQERAFWNYLSGHRLGDLRRLIQIYKRNPEQVFPTGALTPPLIGNYGTSTNIVIPQSERNNPNFQGCLPGA
jgi:hypothetical protein